jgi:hypothetical protein
LFMANERCRKCEERGSNGKDTVSVLKMGIGLHIASQGSPGSVHVQWM